MISDSTTIFKFETLANNAAAKLNELLIIIKDLKFAPEKPPTGFDFELIKIMESKYPGDEPEFRAAKQYYYFFGLLQRFCHTLFYRTNETIASQKLISTHIITYLLAFDTHPLAYQTFFLETELGQNCLHFCLLAFNQSNLWQYFLPRLENSPYYPGLKYCSDLLMHPFENSDIPLFAMGPEAPSTTPRLYTYSTEALITYVIKAKFSILPSSLTLTPDNIHAGAECYHRCFSLLTRGAELSRNFCHTPVLIPLINNYRREVVLNFHMRYRDMAFVQDPRFIPALRNMAMAIVQTMRPDEWQALTLHEVTSIADIFSLKKHHTFDEAAQIYALIDPLILALCRHQLFSRAYELLDTYVAILSLMGFTPEEKKLAQAKLGPVAFMSTFNQICKDPSYQLPEFSQDQMTLFQLMKNTPPPKKYANVLSPIAESSFQSILTIDSHIITDIRYFIAIIRFLKLALPLLPSAFAAKSKITELQEAMVQTFISLLVNNKFSEALQGFEAMQEVPHCVEDIHYFKLELIWPLIIKICATIQVAINENKPISIDALKVDLKQLDKIFTKNTELSKKLDAVLSSLLSDLATQRITDDINPQIHQTLIHLLETFKSLLSTQTYVRLQKQFKVNEYTNHLAHRLFPPPKPIKPGATTVNNTISIPEMVYQTLLDLSTAINYPMALTGAAVFELLHQKTPHDYDILVFGPTMNVLAERLTAKAIQFSRIGKAVEIIQIKLPTGEVIELSAIEAQDTSPPALLALEQLQFNKRDLRLSSLFVLIKTNNKSHVTSQHRSVNYIEPADKPRDVASIQHAHVITSFNCALEDAQNKRLNMVGDAAIILKQDPVRVLRVLKWLLKDAAITMGPSLKRTINFLSTEWLALFEQAQNNNAGYKSRLTKGIITIFTRAPSFLDGLKLLHQYGLLSALCGINPEQTNKLIFLFEPDTFKAISIERQWLYFASLSIKLFHESRKSVDSPVMNLFFWRYQEFYYLNFMQDKLMEVDPPRATVYDEIFLGLLNQITTLSKCSLEPDNTQQSEIQITPV